MPFIAMVRSVGLLFFFVFITVILIDCSEGPSGDCVATNHEIRLKEAKGNGNPGRADLQPLGINIHSSWPYVVGKEIEFQSDILNSGYDFSEIFNVKWFFNGENYGYYGSHRGIAPGEIVGDDNSTAYWIPPTFGNYKIDFEVDVDNHVKELKENNNKSSIIINVRNKEGYYWGTDFDWTVNLRQKKESVSGLLSIPQDFYIAYLGSYRQHPTPQIPQWIWDDEIREKKYLLDQIRPKPVLYAYYNLWGPGKKSDYSAPCKSCIKAMNSLEEDNDEEKRAINERILKDYGKEQADSCIIAFNHYATILPFYKFLVFADIENHKCKCPNGEPEGELHNSWGEFPLDGHQKWRNQKVLEGFLENMPEGNRCIYIDTICWIQYYGKEYQIPEEITPIIWYQDNVQSAAGFDPGREDFNMNRVLAHADSVFNCAEYRMGGISATVCQFKGDKGSVSNKNPKDW